MIIIGRIISMMMGIIMSITIGITMCMLGS